MTIFPATIDSYDMDIIRSQEITRMDGHWLCAE